MKDQIKLYVYDFDPNTLVERMLDVVDETVEVEVNPNLVLEFDVSFLHEPRLLHDKGMAILVCTNKSRLVRNLMVTAREKAEREASKIMDHAREKIEKRMAEIHTWVTARFQALDAEVTERVVRYRSYLAEPREESTEE